MEAMASTWPLLVRSNFPKMAARVSPSTAAHVTASASSTTATSQYEQITPTQLAMSSVNTVRARMLYGCLRRSVVEHVRPISTTCGGAQGREWLRRGSSGEQTAAGAVPEVQGSCNGVGSSGSSWRWRGPHQRQYPHHDKQPLARAAGAHVVFEGLNEHKAAGDARRDRKLQKNNADHLANEAVPHSLLGKSGGSCARLLRLHIIRIKAGRLGCAVARLLRTVARGGRVGLVGLLRWVGLVDLLRRVARRGRARARRVGLLRREATVGGGVGLGLLRARILVAGCWWWVALQRRACKTG